MKKLSYERAMFNCLLKCIVSGLIILSLFWFLVMPSIQKPDKTDGWVFFSGGERHVGHENAIGLCRSVAECEEIYSGCGAVNCECANMSAEQVDDYFSHYGCRFVEGEGIVCKEAGK